ncbi:MAG: EF-P lysine aminoacylase EpmA [Syntrophorhabdaceae bacterium]|nr:EF-P lysine aminoacylase EpmA [Syntrophorhabdaceae bacterium]
MKGCKDTRLNARHELLRSVREFFYLNGYTEVETSNIMETLSPDPNIDPVSVFIGGKGPFYLHTSPEIHMKRLLSYGHKRIFQICKVFRVEELKDIHTIEFTMLEWYREGTYLDGIHECESLIAYLYERFSRMDPPKRPFKVYDLETLFIEKTGINPFSLDRDGLFTLMGLRGFKGIDEKDSWNDLFFKLFLQEVEPKIGGDGPYFIKDWPETISTMAKRKGENKVERFELYIDGLEIANGYTELLDAEEQRERFIKDNRERERMGKEIFPIDEGFLEDLSRLEGTYTGTSIGMDRLLMVLLGKKKIDDVLIHPFRV